MCARGMERAKAVGPLLLNSTQEGSLDWLWRVHLPKTKSSINQSDSVRHPFILHHPPSLIHFSTRIRNILISSQSPFRLSAKHSNCPKHNKEPRLCACLEGYPYSLHFYHFLCDCYIYTINPSRLVHTLHVCLTDRQSACWRTCSKFHTPIYHTRPTRQHGSYCLCTKWQYINRCPDQQRTSASSRQQEEGKAKSEKG